MSYDAQTIKEKIFPLYDQISKLKEHLLQEEGGFNLSSKYIQRLYNSMIDYKEIFSEDIEKLEKIMSFIETTTRKNLSDILSGKQVETGSQNSEPSTSIDDDDLPF